VATPDVFLKSVISELEGIAASGLVVFAAAGTVRYWQAWVYLAVVGISGVLSKGYFFWTCPDVLQRRMPAREGRAAQKLVVTAVFVMWAGMLAVSGLDHRFGWSDVPAPVSVAGNVLVAAATGLVALVLTVNSHAGVTVRVEDGQQITTTGMYRLIRHPMYACNALLSVVTPLALGSYWALTFVVPNAVVLVARIRDEETLLMAELDGYPAYVQQVRFRLVPGIW
jgi:protein-S-isoprenylcysteine O-methyltransferase Ste14